MEYTVRINGRPVKKFQDKQDAQQFMIWFTKDLQAQEMRYNLIEEAVSKSDFKQAQELIQSIMEKK
jgi:thioredoxin-like negative regulator of GroEL